MPRIAPFACFIVLMALEPVLAPFTASLLDPRWLYGVRAGATALLLLAFRGRYGELRNAPRIGAAPWFWAAVAGVVVFLLWIVLDGPPFVIGEATAGFVPLSDEGRLLVGVAAARAAGSALVVPVTEELFWRSWVMRWVQHPRFLAVEPRQVGLRALLISSAVFALEHRLWFAGLLAGLVYGEIYRRTGNLWCAILAHAVTNGLLAGYVLVTGSWSFW